MKFEEILVVAVLTTGFIALLDLIFFKQRRLKKATASSTNATTKEFFVIEYSKSFFPVLLLVLLLRSFLAEPFRIPSSSMVPTLLEGDFIVVNKFNYGLRLPILGTKLMPVGAPRRGDIIVFRHSNNMDLIKRIVGLPGDHIVYKDKTLFINGKEISQLYKGRSFDADAMGNVIPVIHKVEKLNNKDHGIYQQLGSEKYRYPNNDVIVPADHYFVLGDNRDNSIDSRFWGFVRDEDIIGRAFATWMSWDHSNKDIRWGRVGKSIY